MYTNVSLSQKHVHYFELNQLLFAAFLEANRNSTKHLEKQHPNR